MEIKHPTKCIVPVETALREWNVAGGLVQEKKDGQFAIIQVEDFVITAEKMRDGGIWAFDLVTLAGRDMRGEPLGTRWRELIARAGTLTAFGIKIVPSAKGEVGNTFLASILAAGGEGAVRKSWLSLYWTPMEAAKRGGIWICRVASTGGTQSVGIVDAETGADRGRVALRGGKCDQVRVNSIIRVEGLNLTELGKIRQPVPARCWLVSY
jgi:hypothetical protein